MELRTSFDQEPLLYTIHYVYIYIKHKYYNVRVCVCVYAIALLCD